MHARRVAVLAACMALASAGAWWLGGALADDTVPTVSPVDRHPLTIAAKHGRHVRIDGRAGPIHVWVPPDYRPETGATIVYVHGYWDSADSAYTNHRLAEQFAMSAANAMFIVPEAPMKQLVPVNYPHLGEVVRLAEDATGLQRGMALTAVVGHSGAFRTIGAWLDEPLLEQVVLIDGMYANEEVMEAWLRASPLHRLITVGEDTLPWNEQFLRDVRETFVVDRVPPTYDLWPAEARTSRVVYVRAQYAHFPLVTDGIVLPSVIRLLPVELLGRAPWAHPLGDMPPLPDAAVDAPGDASPTD